MAQPKSKNITWHHANVTTAERQDATGQRGCVVWFTGLSGSGKSTVSRRVEQLLLERGRTSYSLDGDNIRHGLNKDLGFSPEDRTENIRRIGEVAKLFADATVITTTAFISPYREDRDSVRSIMPPGTFVEVFVDAPLEVCEERDPKGLYKKARAGIIPEFTGISAPYEEPESPEIVLKTADHDVDACANQVIAFLAARGFVNGR
ncbi:MAG: adenylyl-sulfate kinase [Alphaproteobacteria bacterium]|nr:adenylyl-sulfate kinase [Alphaproteobacteria bacterium]